MTITYTSQVADCKGFGCFWRLLFRWKGSIYKLVWPDLLAYSVLYFGFSAIYRFALDENGKRMFEKTSLYTQYFTEFIPISFVLGFYVSIVMQRWWAQYENLPWPDSLSLYISTSIPGNDDKGRMMRRTIVRYANLAFTLTLGMISPKVKKRFPTLEHLIEAGLLTANELKIFEDLSLKTQHSTYWMPFVWAGTVVARARKEGRIRDDFAVKTIIDEINRLRGLCGTLLGYDWISIPLVYTQVVTLAVYTFFLATLMGRQFLDPKMNYDMHNIDFVFPVFTYLQFFFYMGWLKVAESLVNPFGEDDDDFEINWLIDRNLQVSYLIVDEMHNEHPELIQDIYWDEVYPTELPYTVASQDFKTEPPLGSTANINVPAEEQELLPLVEEETNEELEGVQSENPAYSSSTSNMKRIGSNLSAFFHQPSNILPKSSVISFMQRSSNSIRRPSVRRSIRRVSSKSSDFTMSPGTTNRTASQIYHMSDASLSGSDGGYSPDHHLNSSKESIDADGYYTGRNRGRHRQKRNDVDDDGIQIVIKKKPNEERMKDDLENIDDYTETPIGTPRERSVSFLKTKERTVSGDSCYSQPDSDKPKLSEVKESAAGTASSKLMDYLKPISSKNASSSSLKDQDLHRMHHLPLMPRLSHKSSLKGEFQSRRPFPRGPFLKGLTSSRESGGPEEHLHHQLGTSPNYTPLHDVIMDQDEDGDTVVENKFAVGDSSLASETPVSKQEDITKTFSQIDELPEEQKKSTNEIDEDKMIWL